MDEVIKPAKRWYKKKRWWFVMIAVITVVLAFIYLRGGQEVSYETIVARRDVLIQEVNITGKVKPVQAVDLQFESTGRISAINHKVGDHVKSGGIIASLENQDLQAAVTSAKADLDEVKRNFASLGDPEIFSSLRVELDNAKAGLAQVSKKADSDLAVDYNSAFNSMREAMTQIDTSSVVLEYLRKTYFEAKNPWDQMIQGFQSDVETKGNRVLAIFPEVNNSGTTITPATYNKIDLALQELLNACQSLRVAFTYLQGEIQKNSYLISSSADRTSVNTEAAAISSDLSAVSSALQNITDQRITNDKNISDANAKLATAEASFPNSSDILQKESALLSAQAQLRKSVIVAPFSGQVGKIDVEKGQTVSSSTIIVSLISDADYQIEANITEIDIGKVNIGNSATLTLDAYGPQIVFMAKVLSVDTSSTTVEGVTTYKTIFEFDGPVGYNIRPNMTANIDIETNRKENVIAVPQRAVISKNGGKIVRIYRGDQLPPEDRLVQTGISGRDGFVEILSGLIEGDQVITFVND